MTYDLTFNIAPDLYQRAITVPINGAPPQRRRRIQNIAAAILFAASLFAFNRALFAPQSLVAMCFAAVLTGAVFLGAWWRHHRKLVAVHSTYNDTGGQQTMCINGEGITAARPHITSTIEWAFVRQIRSIDGATLIELPTARLIVPDAALADDTTPAQFKADLMRWQQEAAA